MTIGERIRALRFARGWGPDRLAAEAHVSRTSVWELEAGRVARPRAATVHLLAMALRVPVARLLGLDDVAGFGTEALALAALENSPGRGRYRAVADTDPEAGTDATGENADA